MANQEFRYGDIVYANLDPAAGHEQNKRRPLVVVSSSTFNRHSTMTFVCPITRTDNGYPLHVSLGSIAVRGADETITGFAAIEQTKSLDLIAREAQPVGIVPDQTMKTISGLLQTILLRDDEMVIPNSY